MLTKILLKYEEDAAFQTFDVASAYKASRTKPKVATKPGKRGARLPVHP
jgi:hypothetical protein